ncbi:AraC family transcriptional regulator [Oxalobacter aliiformigenes]|uniref:helix-turn-helix transcriptional regulator n=1 Tax=Oxalobacter aliiformigenes TaxID=2946593 RepID=UPI0022AE7397|nr:AraC family transcriptional regulator [Oxalobacter aliiformigenes]MCZ4065022.1 AraC family transcriptional regulator [Oxalobacter aliiformigenes]WAW00079.1 AraC family transcriptional regulator [Oxalobacter aliiformigenes]
MKVVQRKIIHDIGQSLSLAHFPHLSYPVHRHDEYELVIMTSGTGREYIGQAVADYRAGDMTLIGRDIPHLHLCDTMTGRKTGKESTCEILYFSANLFPENMSGIPEYAVVAALLEKSAGGIRYSDPALTRDIRRRVKKLDRAEGIIRIQWLFSILDRLGHARETSVIAPLPAGNGVSREHRTTLDRIGHYLTEHFRDPLTLERLAREIGMNPSALCRHFRQRTGKTLFAVLNEIRISHACRLLRDTQQAISAIAWESGFANLSHFNRQFKSLTGQTPGEYRKNIRSKVE